MKNSLPQLPQRNYGNLPTLVVAMPHLMTADMITEWQFNCHFRPLAIINDGFLIVRKIQELKPDFILIDSELPNLNLLKFIETLKTLDPKPQLMLYASQPKVEYSHHLWSSANSNVRGFVHKGSGIQELEDCFREVFAGRRYVSTTFAEYLDLIEKSNKIATQGYQFDIATLTPQEKAVWDLMAKGRDQSQIAVELRLKLSSVKTYKRRIRERLDIPPHEKLTNIAIRYDRN
jgi:DNA-binding NarL/FixJ family response regulator